MSIERRGKFWHVRYRVDGESRSESTRSTDRAIAEELDRRRSQELMERNYYHRSLRIANKPEMRRSVGGVYFLLHPVTGLIKIGSSAKPKSRLRGFKTLEGGMPFELIALVHCSNFKTLEQFLHRKWTFRRVERVDRGREWFNFSGLELGRAIGDAIRMAQ